MFAIDCTWYLSKSMLLHYLHMPSKSLKISLWLTFNGENKQLLVFTEHSTFHFFSTIKIEPFQSSFDFVAEQTKYEKHRSLFIVLLFFMLASMFALYDLCVVKQMTFFLQKMFEIMAHYTKKAAVFVCCCCDENNLEICWQKHGLSNELGRKKNR